MYDGVIPKAGLAPVGEAWLVPDWSTLHILPYAPTHASVVSDLFKDGSPWSLCPHGFLKQAIATGKKAGLQILDIELLAGKISPSQKFYYQGF